MSLKSSTMRVKFRQSLTLNSFSSTYLEYFAEKENGDQEIVDEDVKFERIEKESCKGRTKMKLFIKHSEFVREQDVKRNEKRKEIGRDLSILFVFQRVFTLSTNCAKNENALNVTHATTENKYL